MEKIAYKKALVEAVRRRAKVKRLPARHDEAFRRLCEQYASIVSADRLSQHEFHQDALDRAYGARTMRPTESASFDELLEASPGGPDYEAAMPFMPELLQEALATIEFKAS